MIQYQSNGDPYRTWTCTEDDCSGCAGEKCNELTTRVLIKGEVSNADDLYPFSDCKYGDVVIFESTNGLGFYTYEVAVIEKEGDCLS